MPILRPTPNPTEPANMTNQGQTTARKLTHQFPPGHTYSKPKTLYKARWAHIRWNTQPELIWTWSIHIAWTPGLAQKGSHWSFYLPDLWIRAARLEISIHHYT